MILFILFIDVLGKLHTAFLSAVPRRKGFNIRAEGGGGVSGEEREGVRGEVRRGEER